jgi:hypothetical protein
VTFCRERINGGGILVSLEVVINEERGVVKDDDRMGKYPIIIMEEMIKLLLLLLKARDILDLLENGEVRTMVVRSSWSVCDVMFFVYQFSTKEKMCGGVCGLDYM